MEAVLRTELARIAKMRTIIIEDSKELGLVDPYAMRAKDGTYAMMPLIVAESNVMLALAILKKRK